MTPSTAELAETVREILLNPQIQSEWPSDAPEPEDVLAALAVLEERATQAEAERDETKRSLWREMTRTEAAAMRADRLEAALREIAEQGCERSVPPHNCDEEPRLSHDALYGGDRVCDPCHARRALADTPSVVLPHGGSL